MTKNANLLSHAIDVNFPMTVISKGATPYTTVTPSDLEIMQEIIYRHSISLSTFNSLVYSFFAMLPKDLSPTVKTAEAVQQSLEQYGIEDRVNIEVTEVKTNSDLIFTPTITYGLPEVSSYSVGLLKGLCCIFPGCKFKFYKAHKYFAGQNLKNTIVFAVELNDIQVYLGDLSEMHP